MNDSQEKRKGGVPSKQKLYQLAAAHAEESIKTLIEIVRNGDSDSNKIGAAKILLSKCIPDLKSAELSGKDGEVLTFIIKRD